MNDPNEKKSILIVDDVPDNIDVLVEVLSGDYRTKVALDGKKALELCSGEKIPDLILLDVMMPEIDGYEVCRKLKENENTKKVPVIFVTAKGEEVHETMGFDLGAVDYITKPINPDILKARVKTHLKLLEQRREIENTVNELQELEEMRDKLVHMIVHDLRSPLSAILGFSQLNLMKIDNIGEIPIEDLKKSMKTILLSSQNMESMITSILDVSKLESGEMQITPVKFDAAALLNSEIENFSVQSENKGIKLLADTETESITVNNDKKLLERILQNLISNALKYTPNGSTVNLSIKKDDDYVIFSVKDNGPGILPEHQSKIFDKFFQIQMKGKGGKYGVGLGLAFCKMAADALKGKIWVESEGAGKGSTFFVRLPVGS